MSTPYTVPVRVLDKRIKDGWFVRSYYLTIRCLTSAEDSASPILSAEKVVHEVKVDADRYYSTEVGAREGIVLHKHADGSVYPWPEDES